MGRAQMTSWPGTVGDRMAFERGARAVYPSLRGRRPRRRGSIAFRYTVTIDVPFYDSRQVAIEFRSGSTHPFVTVDGPQESPHRYDDGTLCMWVPTDANPERWTFHHGLLDLLDAVRAHLFREAWWRETRDDSGVGEWLGPELPHGTIGLPPANPEQAA